MSKFVASIGFKCEIKRKRIFQNDVTFRGGWKSHSSTLL